MKAVNLYVLSKLATIDSELGPIYEKALTNREKKAELEPRELKPIETIVSNLEELIDLDTTHSYNISCYDNWFYSFSIPQISKEIDLLKIGKIGHEQVIINIELKSQPIPEEEIKYQLIQNQYYLSHISDKIYSFTFVAQKEKGNLYALDSTNHLKTSSFKELLDILSQVKRPITENIESLFKPEEYLISPLNEPEKFLEDKYYLTNHQKEIKRRINGGLVQRQKTLWGITGEPGTGKTLLLYDIAKNLSKQYKVCMIHSGPLSQGHKRLNELMIKSHIPINIINVNSLSKNLFNTYDIICIDETQRLSEKVLDCILESYNNQTVCACIFSYDFEQVLLKTEKLSNNPKRLRQLPNFFEEKLTDSIRSNKEVFSFIKHMMDLKVPRWTKSLDYSNIDILYATTAKEANHLVAIYQNKGYEFITLTNDSNALSSYEVIGQEFSKVVVKMDKTFSYNEDGRLQGEEHPEYFSTKLIYQNITRAREKLCIIVLENLNLFEKLLKLKVNYKRRVLFVCDESLTHSLMVKYIIKDLLRKTNLSSQFFIDFQLAYSKNFDDYRIKQKLTDYGIYHESGAEKQNFKKDYKLYDDILVMNQASLEKIKTKPKDKVKCLLDFTSHPGDILDVDPTVDSFDEDFDTAYRQIFEGCQAFFEKYGD
ncbi:hypothetical protein P261_02805 [Lachnospiraceae bacterium TWA4]|nr:hypothetical protein P261_02805 [Lachnospiraceae bacterium TWA4]